MSDNIPSPLDEVITQDTANNSDPAEASAAPVDDEQEVQAVAPASLKKDLPIYQRPAPTNPRRRLRR